MNIIVSSPTGSLEPVIAKLLKLKLDINRVYTQTEDDNDYRIEATVSPEAETFRREMLYPGSLDGILDPGYITTMSAGS